MTINTDLVFLHEITDNASAPLLTDLISTSTGTLAGGSNPGLTALTDGIYGATSGTNTQHIECPDPTGGYGFLNSDFTIAIRFSSTSLVNFTKIFSIGASTDDDDLFNMGSRSTNTQMQASLRGTSGGSILDVATGAVGFNDGLRHVAVFTRSGNSCNLYVDGTVSDGSGTYDGTSITVDQMAWFTNWRSSKGQYQQDSEMYWAAGWSKVLSSGEITTLNASAFPFSAPYNAGSSAATRLIGSSLVGGILTNSTLVR